MKPKVVLFDFNGVLLWDAAWHEQAWQKMSLLVRKKKLSQQEMRDEVHGKANREILSFLLGKPVSKAQLAKYKKQKETAYQKIALSKGKKFALSPGAIRFLDLLKDNNIKRNIATSSPSMNVKFYFKHLGLSQWFNQRKVVYDNDKRPSKPAPDIYLAAANKLGVKLSQCVIAEDSKAGLEAAAAAKANKIIAITGNSSLKKPKADIAVKSLDLLKIKDLI